VILKLTAKIQFIFDIGRIILKVVFSIQLFCFGWRVGKPSMA